MDFLNEKLRRIAFHEAGHAWMMEKVGIRVKHSSVKAFGTVTGDNRGETVPEKPIEKNRRDLSDKFARAALAGSATEHYLLGSWDDEGLTASAYDTGRAKSYLSMSGDDIKPEALGHYVMALANSVLEEISRPGTWHSITQLAYALMESGTLDGEKVREIVGADPDIASFEF